MDPEREENSQAAPDVPKPFDEKIFTEVSVSVQLLKEMKEKCPKRDLEQSNFPGFLKVLSVYVNMVTYPISVQGGDLKEPSLT